MGISEETLSILDAHVDGYDEDFILALARIGDYAVPAIEVTHLATCVLVKNSNNCFSRGRWDAEGLCS